MQCLETYSKTVSAGFYRLIAALACTFRVHICLDAVRQQQQREQGHTSHARPQDSSSVHWQHPRLQDLLFRPTGGTDVISPCRRYPVEKHNQHIPQTSHDPPPQGGRVPRVSEGPLACFTEWALTPVLFAAHLWPEVCVADVFAHGDPARPDVVVLTKQLQPPSAVTGGIPCGPGISWFAAIICVSTHDPPVCITHTPAET